MSNRMIKVVHSDIVFPKFGRGVELYNISHCWGAGKKSYFPGYPNVFGLANWKYKLSSLINKGYTNFVFILIDESDNIYKSRPYYIRDLLSAHVQFDVPKNAVVRYQRERTYTKARRRKY